jgi:hypothetical protein
MIGTVVDPIDPNAAFPELLDHPLGEALEVGFAVITTSDPCLVGDYDQQKIQILRRGAEFEDPGDEVEIRNSVDIVLLDIDYAVPIQK